MLHFEMHDFSIEKIKPNQKVLTSTCQLQTTGLDTILTGKFDVCSFVQEVVIIVQHFKRCYLKFLIYQGYAVRNRSPSTLCQNSTSSSNNALVSLLPQFHIFL